MRNGTIDLSSGRWHWTLIPQWTGATIVFQHRDRVHDEMRSWTPEHELTDEQARELAADAVERTWMDVDGLKWRVSLDFPSDWRREARGLDAEEPSMWLVFQRGGLKKTVRVAEGTHLGELSHNELKLLLENAFRPNSGYTP